MKTIFGEDGILKAIHDRFEFRQEQLVMAEFVLETVVEGENGLVEAGTGTGKTLAYLIPSLAYALESGKKLAISTETKALQRQLMEKDIPLARQAIKEFCGKDFEASLCLGSANYPCRRKFEMVLQRGAFRGNDAGAVEMIGSWFRKKEIFTRFDVRVSSDLWVNVMRDPDVCTYFTCPFSSACPYQMARKEWARSQVLVLNHHLFFSNINSGRSYLPQFDIVIFDEAHSLEDIASDQLGFSVEQIRIREILYSFYRKNKRGSLVSLIKKDDLRKKIISLVNKCTGESDSFFESIRKHFPQGVRTLRLRDELKDGAELVNLCNELYMAVSEMESEIDNEHRKLEYEIARSGLFVNMENLKSIVNFNNDDHVYWMEVSGEELLGDMRLRGQPIDVSHTLDREVYAVYDTTMCVSATLAVNGDFSYLAERLGMERYRSLCLQSPYEYSTNVAMMLDPGSPEPGDPAYIDRAASTVFNIIEYLKGNCLVLFTSYKMLEDVKKKLLQDFPYPVFAQGEYTAPESLEMYTATEGSVLMGTHSFWQGIDLPGDLLRGVVMMRLPFSVPDRPAIQARIEQLEKTGRNPFYHYQLPGAVIKFRQGFGRLIRGKTDRGIIAILDPRITTKSYGRFFLRSVPQCIMVKSIDDLKHQFPLIQQ